MGEVQGVNDRYLKMGTALPLVYKKAETYLQFMGLARPIPEKGKAFLYRTDALGMSGDTNRPTGLPMIQVGSDLPELNIGRASTAADVTSAQGFSMRITHDILREEIPGQNELMKAYNTAGFWLAYIINDAWLTAAKAGAGTTSTFSPGAVWSAATANPFIDLLALSQDMERDGYMYELTDVFLHKTNFYELRKYLTQVDVEMLRLKEMYGLPTTNKHNLTVPAVADVHSVISGLDEGSIMGMDRNNPGIELHYFNDPKFSAPQVNYETIVDGQRVRQTAPNYGMHFNQYEEDKSHDTVLQFWWEGKYVVTESYSLIYAGSGI